MCIVWSETMELTKKKMQGELMSTSKNLMEKHCMK